MINFKALGRALVPSKSDLATILGISLLLVILTAAVAIVVGILFGIAYALTLVFGTTAVETVSWVAGLIFWFWILFGDVIVSRYKRYANEDK